VAASPEFGRFLVSALAAEQVAVAGIERDETIAGLREALLFYPTQATDLLLRLEAPEGQLEGGVRFPWAAPLELYSLAARAQSPQHLQEVVWAWERDG
jgi:hypothetical protein